MTALTPREIEVLTAVVDCLIPADDAGPSASQAGVVDFIELQLRGTYGSGARTFVRLVDRDHDARDGRQLPPGNIYRDGLGRLNELARSRFGGEFTILDEPSRIDLLKKIETAAAGFETLKPFFDLVLENTMEGYFSDPIHKGNRDAASWKMIGFPGCGHDYRDFVGKNIPVSEQVPLRSIAMLRNQG